MCFLTQPNLTNFPSTDRPGLRNPELLMRIQNKLKAVLNQILLPQHPENDSIFPELMTMVHDLRTLNTLHTEKFLQQCKINENGQTGSEDLQNIFARLVFGFFGRSMRLNNGVLAYAKR